MNSMDGREIVITQARFFLSFKFSQVPLSFSPIVFLESISTQNPPFDYAVEISLLENQCAFYDRPELTTKTGA